mgnify:CR=1 FL=1
MKKLFCLLAALALLAQPLRAAEEPKRYLALTFDDGPSGELTERLAAYLCARKGIAPEAAAPIPMAAYREQQFDLLADGVRRALDMDAVYAAIGLVNPKGDKK